MGVLGGWAVSYERGTPLERLLLGGEAAGEDAEGAPIPLRVQVRLRKVDIRLPGKGNSNSHGARPVHLIISMIKWIRTSRFSIKNSLSTPAAQERNVRLLRIDTDMATMYSTGVSRE